ncbi:MAG: hypothetical protein ABI759_11305 [Candidatus Solibacter sp.]
MRPTLLLLTICIAAAGQSVVDRIAVVVGDQVITESEVHREVRLTAFLNGEPLDLSAASRRTAAERLVDQQLIRTEMQVAGYPPVRESEGPALLADFRRKNYPNDAAFRALLAKYGLGEEDLEQHLLRQVSALRFTEQRFRLTNPATTESADRVANPVASGTAGAETEDQMDAWLKQARSGTKIQFKKGAFQ